MGWSCDGLREYLTEVEGVLANFTDSAYLAGFLVRRMLRAKPAEFLVLNSAGLLLLVLGG